MNGSEGREVSTTMAFVGMLRKMLKDQEIGKLIVPDRARRSAHVWHGITLPYGRNLFERGAEIRTSGCNTLLYYKESERRTDFGRGNYGKRVRLASFIAAGTAYSTNGINTIPFFIYYSMFGFQRIGDFIWAAADHEDGGFMLGGTSGRTTLSGEGLQHQDGKTSHVLALPVPNLHAYDPA